MSFLRSTPNFSSVSFLLGSCHFPNNRSPISRAMSVVEEGRAASIAFLLSLLRVSSEVNQVETC